VIDPTARGLEPLTGMSVTAAPDIALDRIARVVQRQLSVPVALVSIVEPDRQVFPGLAGLGGWAGETRQTPLSHSFCQHVVRRQGPLIVRDARRDPLVHDNLAIEDLGVVAYLGMPISGPDDTVVGSLCAIDTEPREWTSSEILALEDLAALCSAELASRAVGPHAVTTGTRRRAPHRDYRQLRAVVDSLPAMVGYWDRDLRNVIANHAYVDWFGKTPTEVVGSHIQDLLGTDLYLRNEPRLRAALNGERQDFARTIVVPDGTSRHTQASYIPDLAEDGSVLGFFVHIFDVSELTEAGNFHDAVLAASPDLIYVVDLRTGAVTWASRSFTELLGYTPADVIGLGEDLYRSLIHPDDMAVLADANATALTIRDGEAIRLKLRARHADGRYRWFLRRITPFERDAEGTVVRVLGLTRDIQESVELTDRLEAAAVHDDLTGLPNRRLLTDRLNLAMSRQSRTGRPVPVLYLDLDGFKRVNDTSGHKAGDAVLQATAQRLQELLRPEDTVARIGGDEFVVVLEPVPQVTGSPIEPGQDVAFAQEVAERIGVALAKPVVVDGHEHFVSASVGIALALPEDDPGQVLRNADAAMYKAKARGKSRWEMFDRTLRDSILDRARVEATLRAVLRAEGSTTDSPVTHGAALWVEYQPIFDLDSGALIAAEALARMRDEHGVTIPPMDFIPVAEETGLIGRLGRRVLDTSCRDLARWHALAPAHGSLTMSVNVSARQAAHADLVADVEHALQANGLPFSALTLELTESVLLEAGRSTMASLTALRERGTGIAIDDFGTGYASLRYLAQLPVTSVKVDRSFTAGLPHDSMSVSIVRAIRGLARDLQIGCVVEGIETQEQRDALPDGVLGQGFHLGRPMSESAMRHLLTRVAIPTPRPGALAGSPVPAATPGIHS